MGYSDRYTLINRGENSYFIGSNTGDGFRLSRDPALAEENCDRLLILKGGPGTGKSTLMRSFSERAAGAGYEVTKYYCSSDPDSLDAVRAESKDRVVLVCDGTAPHVTEMKYPGAVSEIFDLSRFWDNGALIPRRQEIASLSAKKKDCFSRAASALRASRDMSRAAASVGREYVDHDKLGAFARRTAAKIRPDKGGRREVVTSALSMKGAVTLDAYASSEVFFVEDCYGASPVVLNALSDALAEREVSHEVSICPEDPTRYESLYINGIARLYTASYRAPAARILNTARFVKSEVREHRTLYRFAAKCASDLIKCALDSLSEAEKYHFALEDIYTPAMDFDSLTKRAEERMSTLL